MIAVIVRPQQMLHALHQIQYQRGQRTGGKTVADGNDKGFGADIHIKSRFDAEQFIFQAAFRGKAVGWIQESDLHMACAYMAQQALKAT